MKFRKFEVTVAIPDDKKPDGIKANEMLEILRYNNCDFGAGNCSIEIKEIRNNKQKDEQ